MLLGDAGAVVVHGQRHAAGRGPHRHHASGAEAQRVVHKVARQPAQGDRIAANLPGGRLRAVENHLDAIAVGRLAAHDIRGRQHLAAARNSPRHGQRIVDQPRHVVEIRSA
jgi:hypothetical protein